jgi:hypothetical protein
MSVESWAVAECPQCGKKALVQRSSDKYQCLWCDFTKDFAEPKQKPSNSDEILPLTVLVLLMLVFLLQFLAPVQPPLDAKPAFVEQAE